MRHSRHNARGVWWIAGIIGFLVLAIVVATVVIFPVPELPSPTGKRQVGTKKLHLTDQTRPEPFTAEAGDFRELDVQVWYPARPNANTPAAPYIDNSAALDVFAKKAGLPRFFLDRSASVRTHSYLDAPPAVGRFPVVVFIPDYSTMKDLSLAWIEELASRGYVVLSVDQPGIAASVNLSSGGKLAAIDEGVLRPLMPLAMAEPGARGALNGMELPGGLVPFLASDVSFLVGQLEQLNAKDPALGGHVDTGQVAAVGLGLGGFVAAQACQKDDRIKACVIADGGAPTDVQASGLNQPTMIMSRPVNVMRDERAATGRSSEAEMNFMIQGQEALYSKAKNGAVFVNMPTMFHLNWTDVPLWTPAVKWMGLAGKVDARKGVEAVGACSGTFLDSVLKAEPEADVVKVASGYSDVSVRKR